MVQGMAAAQRILIVDDDPDVHGLLDAAPWTPRTG